MKHDTTNSGTAIKDVSWRWIMTCSSSMVLRKTPHKEKPGIQWRETSASSEGCIDIKMILVVPRNTDDHTPFLSLLLRDVTNLLSLITYHVQDQLCEWGQNQNPNFTKRQKYEYYALQSIQITTNQCMMKETLLGMGQGQALICFLSTLTWVNCLPPKNGMPGSWHSSITNAPFYFDCYTWYNPE